MIFRLVLADVFDLVVLVLVVVFGFVLGHSSGLASAVGFLIGCRLFPYRRRAAVGLYHRKTGLFVLFLCVLVLCEICLIHAGLVLLVRIGFDMLGLARLFQIGFVIFRLVLADVFDLVIPVLAFVIMLLCRLTLSRPVYILRKTGFLLSLRNLQAVPQLVEIQRAVRFAAAVDYILGHKITACGVAVHTQLVEHLPILQLFRVLPGIGVQLVVLLIAERSNPSLFSHVGSKTVQAPGIDGVFVQIRRVGVFLHVQTLDGLPLLHGGRCLQLRHLSLFLLCQGTAVHRGMGGPELVACHPVGQAVDPGQTRRLIFPIHLDQPAVAGGGVLFFHLIGILDEILLDASAAVLHVGPGCPGEIVVPGSLLCWPRVSAGSTGTRSFGSIGSGCRHRCFLPGICSLLNFLLALGLAHQVIHLVECLHAGFDGGVLHQPLDGNRVPVMIPHLVQLLLLFYACPDGCNSRHCEACQRSPFDNGFLHLVAEFIPKSHPFSPSLFQCPPAVHCIKKYDGT